MQYHYFELKNGMRSVLSTHASPVAHIGLIIGAGSRDEQRGEHGLAHFIEHMVFKGTRARKSRQILNYIDIVGGDLNAFTTREETCLHASVPVEFTERAVDLLADVFNHGTFPEKELEREKEVVIDEIRSYRDMPDETILDEFESKLFKGHALGRCVQGTEESVASFDRNALLNFVNRHYSASTTVVSCVGNIEPKKWETLFKRYFEEVPPRAQVPKRKPFRGQNVFEESLTKNIYQSHCVVGTKAYSIQDKRRTGLVFLNNLLGGPGNNSRLNLEIRERHGLSYHIESNFVPYMETGTFLIYLGTDRKNLDRALSLVMKELSLLRSKRLSTTALHHAQQQLCGQLILGHESGQAEMLSAGKSTLIRGKVYSIQDAIHDIRKLDPGFLLDIANEVFMPEGLSRLTFQSS